MSFDTRLGQRIAVPLVLCGMAWGQIVQGAGFDPEPVRLPSSIAETTPRPITMMDLLGLRDVVGISISPDGKLVAFVLQQAVYQSNSYRTGLFIVSTGKDAVLKQLGSAGIPHWDEINGVQHEAPQWSQDNEHIRLRAKWERNSTWQVWEWNIDGGPPIQLTRVPGDVEEYQQLTGEMVLKVRPRPDPALAQRTVEHGVLYDGLIHAWEALPITTEILEAQPPSTETWIGDDYSAAQRKATEKEAEQLDPNLRTETCGIQPKHGYKPTSMIVDQKVSPDKQLVAFRCYLGDSSANNTQLFIRARDSNHSVNVTPNTYCVVQYWWTGDSSEIVYAGYHNDGHSNQLALVSARGGQAKTVSLPQQWFFSDFSFDATGNLVVAVQETNTVPPRVALIDLKNQTVRTLVDVNPEFASIQLSSPTRIEGINRYGEKWFAHLVKPFDYIPGRRYPLIVTTYRSGDWFLRGASGNENPIQVYAANGFMVLSFDVGRNPPVPAGDFKAAVRVWSSPTASIEDAVRRLCRAGLIDPGRIGITGFSHGSEILAYAISHSRVFSAAIGEAGGREPYFYYMAGKQWHDIFDAWGLGGWPEGKQRKRWAAVAATLHANRINTPLLTNAADSEFIGDLALFTSLQQLGKPVELFIYANELHYKNQPRHRYEIYGRNLDWFRFWLMDEQDTSPDKIEQYHRWAQLKRQRLCTDDSRSPQCHNSIEVPR